MRCTAIFYTTQTWHNVSSFQNRECIARLKKPSEKPYYIHYSYFIPLYFLVAFLWLFFLRLNQCTIGTAPRDTNQPNMHTRAPISLIFENIDTPSYTPYSNLSCIVAR